MQPLRKIFGSFSATKKALVTRYIPNRFNATVATATKPEEPQDYRAPEQIPGPKSFPVIGTLYKYLPFFGGYTFDKYLETSIKIKNDYGDLVREEIMPGYIIYHVFEVEQIEELFRNAGKFPDKPPIEAIKKYRLMRNKSPGLSALNGQEWHELRLMVQKPLLRLASMQRFIPAQGPVVDQLVENVRTLRDPATGDVDNFMKELYKAALESVSVVVFGKGVGVLDLNLPPDALPLRFISTIGSYFVCLHKTYVFWSMHKNGKTKLWKQFVKDTDFLFEILNKYAEDCIQRFKNNETKAEDSFLLSMLAHPSVTRAAIDTVIADLFFGGVEATSHALGFTLYNLAKNQDVQEKLYQEIQEYIPRGSPYTPERYNNMLYLKSVMKENFRVNPPVTAHVRMTSQDTFLSGYKIPKGSLCFCHTGVAGMNEDNAYSPLEFKPERWLHDAKSGMKPNPFIVTPFGYGSRSCIGKRFAEQVLLLSVSELVRNFKIEYHHEDVGMVTKLLNYPDKPLKLRFLDRE